MLLPTKHIIAERSILGVGSRVLKHLNAPATIDEIWNRFDEQQPTSGKRIDFGWFILALCALYAMDQVSLDGAVLTRKKLP